MRLRRSIAVIIASFTLAFSLQASAYAAGYAVWNNVAHCESNDRWEILGSAYPDSLGITARNWAVAGGRPLAPTSYAPMKERLYEVKIANVFWRQYGYFVMPDQPYGNCTGSY